MLIIDLTAGLLFGALSGMGIGGGGLLVIYLTLVRGTAQAQAQGLNLYFFIFASAAALFIHVRRRKLNYRALLICTPAGMAAAWAGSALAASSRPELLRKVFGAMLILCGAAVLIRMIRQSREKHKIKQ